MQQDHIIASKAQAVQALQGGSMSQAIRFTIAVAERQNDTLAQSFMQGYTCEHCGAHDQLHVAFHTQVIFCMVCESNQEQLMQAVQ